jgi:transposase
MVVKNIPYDNPKEYLYLDQKRKLAVQKRLQKQLQNYQFSADHFIFFNYFFCKKLQKL